MFFLFSLDFASTMNHDTSNSGPSVESDYNYSTKVSFYICLVITIVITMYCICRIIGTRQYSAHDNSDPNSQSNRARQTFHQPFEAAIVVHPSGSMTLGRVDRDVYVLMQNMKNEDKTQNGAWFMNTFGSVKYVLVRNIHLLIQLSTDSKGLWMESIFFVCSSSSHCPLEEFNTQCIANKW